MGEEELSESILLVFANKQDLPEARSVQDVAEELGLQELQNRVWYIQAKRFAIYCSCFGMRPVEHAAEL